jgi:DNA repair protein RadC
VTALLNAKLRLIGCHIVSVGSLSKAIAHPREIYRATILAGAHAHVLMYNHPSGDPAPRDADRPSGGGFMKRATSWRSVCSIM